ncbi:hypothetical protein CAAN1_20S02652 [[Candida] anglica]|uniref:Uncharacterized protein n=1 Tax=[Candida] anglica TaxID=148631 RepID=A0ABP0EJ45_9ASCO
MSYLQYSETKKESAALIRCPFKGCNARVIPTKSLQTVKVANSPQMTSLNEKDTHTEFYQVNDVWDFDNIGVSRPSDELEQPTITTASGDELEIAVQRLLICSECDRGPLGFAGISSGDDEKDHKNLKYFLSCTSVLYEQK